MMLRTVYATIDTFTSLQYSNANTSCQVLGFDAEAIFNAIILSLRLEGLNITALWLMLTKMY